MPNISFSWYFWHIYFAWSNLGSSIPACVELYVQWEILLCFPTISFANFLVELKVKVVQSRPTLCDPHGLSGPWNSPGQNTGVGSLSLLQGNLPNPGIKPRSPALQADSLPAEPQGEPKNTGVGSLSLLQRIFLTQDQTGVSCIAGRFLTTELSGKPIGELNVPIKIMCSILLGSWLWFFGCCQQNWDRLNWVQYKSLQKKQIVMCLILRKCTYLWVRWYSL